MSLVKTSRTKKYPQLISTFIFEFKKRQKDLKIVLIKLGEHLLHKTSLIS